jgi:hypothetical protein
MNAVVESKPTESAQTRAVAMQPMSPMQMVALAVQQGMPIETLRELRQMQKEWEADEARRLFNEAFTAFKAEAIVIVKNTLITDGPLKGKKHANLFDVVSAVTPKLSAHGLAISWKLTKDEPTWMEVTCTLRHAAGYSESVSMGSGPDTGPGRNAIQARCSAKTYLERYTATAILGLATQDADDDGNKAGGGPELITEKQAADLKAKITEVGANQAQFMKFLKVEKLSDLPAKQYLAALQALKDKAQGNR